MFGDAHPGCRVFTLGNELRPADTVVDWFPGDDPRMCACGRLSQYLWFAVQGTCVLIGCFRADGYFLVRQRAARGVCQYELTAGHCISFEEAGARKSIFGWDADFDQVYLGIVAHRR